MNTLFSAFIVLATFSGVAQAHFRLLFPEPRGVFVADIEPNFCGGYDNAVSNRSQFPLSGGFFTISTGHPKFTVGALISTVQNPTSFDNFSVDGQQQVVSPFAIEPDAGEFCIPLNLTAAGISGVKDGANVTIQIVFDGSDGNLYQCADLTLSSNYTIPSSNTCSNTSATATASASDSTATESASSQNGSMGGMERISICVAMLTAGALASLLL